MADKEISLDRQDSADTGKQAENPKAESTHAPLLIEFSVTVSVIFLVLVFLTVVGISLFTGATLLDFILRTGVTISIIGLLLVTIIRQISSGMAAVNERKQPDEATQPEMQSQSEVK